MSGAELLFAPEVAEALAANRAVVALESSVFAQGLPVPANREAYDRMITAVRAAGAVPAVIGVVEGALCVGLTTDAIDRFLRREAVVKVSSRDLPAAQLLRQDGATTVSAAIVIARRAGIRVFATGGIGGVHRGNSCDESADLLELSRTAVVCVSAGPKAVLDVRATMERLETLCVPVVGFRVSEVPGFFSAGTGVPIGLTLDTPELIADLYAKHVALGRNAAVLVMQPPPSDSALPAAQIDLAVEKALREALGDGTLGKDVTPRLLAAVERETEGKSVATNVALLESNATLAARIAVALCDRRRDGPREPPKKKR